MEKYSEYKDSGVQWLQQIPGHWEMSKVSSHFRQRNEKVSDQDYPALSVSKLGVTPQLENVALSNAEGNSRKLVRVGDYAVNSRSDRKGACGVSKYEGSVSLITIVLEPRNIFGDYVHYLFRSTPWVEEFYRNGRGIVADLWTTNYQMMKGMYLPLPPLHEQQAIVSYLDDKCGKIDQLLENKAKEIELCREAIESMIFSSTDSSMTAIDSWETCFPESWKTKLGRALFEEVKIKGTQEDRFLAVTQDNGLIYKDGGDVNFVTAENKETQKLVKPGQFVISLRSFEGGIEYSDKTGLISAAYVVLKLREQYDSEELRMYYRFLFKSKPFVQRLNTISDSMRDGKSIKFKDIRYFKFPIPSEERLRRILVYIQVYDKLKITFREERERLVEYKQRLISDVVTGQIKVC